MTKRIAASSNSVAANARADRWDALTSAGARLLAGIRDLTSEIVCRQIFEALPLGDELVFAVNEELPGRRRINPCTDRPLRHFHDHLPIRCDLWSIGDAQLVCLIGFQPIGFPIQNEPFSCLCFEEREIDYPFQGFTIIHSPEEGHLLTNQIRVPQMTLESLGQFNLLLQELPFAF